MTFLEIIFYSFAILLVLSASMSIFSKTAVASVLWLISAFFNSAALFIMQGAEYLAMTLVIVYVGAVAVLFLFVIMMLNIKKDEQNIMRNLYTYICMLIFLIILSHIVFSLYQSANLFPISTTLQLEYMTNNTKGIGKVLYTTYILPFQMGGVVLLIAMIGAILLTLNTTRPVRRQDIYKQVSRTRADAVELVEVKSKTGIKI